MQRRFPHLDASKLSASRIYSSPCARLHLLNLSDVIVRFNDYLMTKQAAFVCKSWCSGRQRSVRRTCLPATSAEFDFERLENGLCQVIVDKITFFNIVTRLCLHPSCEMSPPPYFVIKKVEALRGPRPVEVCGRAACAR